MKTIVLTSTYYTPHFGGVENSIYYLSRAYKKNGFKVIILVSDSDLSKKGRLPTIEEEGDVQIVRFKRYIPHIYIDYAIKPIIDIWRGYETLKGLKGNHNIINIISRSPETALFSLMSKIKTGYLVPGIVKFQNGVKINNALDLKGIIKKYFVLMPSILVQRLAFLKVDVLFVFSKNMEQQVWSFLGKKIKTKQVNPGVDTEKFKPVLRVDSVGFKFIIVGRLIKIKGIDMAIRSFAAMRNKKSRLIIIGDGPEFETLKKQVVGLAVSDRVIFTGSVKENIHQYYQESDCYLMTSIHETFGQTIIEALASGLPVIAWKSTKLIETATSEIIENRRNGLLIDFSEEKLKDAMDEISVYSKTQLDKLKNNNIALVNSKYSWDFLANEMIK